VSSFLIIYRSIIPWHYRLFVVVADSIVLCTRRYMCICVYVSVCSLITRKRVGRLHPNFQGSSRAPRKWLQPHKKLGSWVGSQKIYTFCFPLHRLARCGQLGSPSGPIALGSISYKLASRLEAWYTAVRAGSVYSLTGQQDGVGWARYRAGILPSWTGRMASAVMKCI